MEGTLVEIAPEFPEWQVLSKDEYQKPKVACCENAIVSLSGTVTCPECDN